MFSTQRYSGFDPRTIPGCSFWLDGADSTTMTFSSGSNISTWKDKSSNGYTGTAYNSPTFTSNTINGVSAVTFNGTSQYVDFGNVANLGTNSVYIFAVAKYDTTADGTILAKSSYRAFSGRWGLFRVGSTMYNFVDQNASNIVTSYGDATTTPELVSGYWDRSNIYVFQNASQKASAAGTGTISISNTDPLYIAGYPNSTGTGPQAGFYLPGKIGEIIVYIGSPLSTIQRQQVEGYLAWKWGLKSSFPGTHPFYYTPLAVRDFGPIDVSPCLLWLDAADSNAVTLSGSNVTTWKDKSGNGYNFTQATSTQYPVYTTNAVNGLSAISFTGAGTNGATTQKLDNTSIVLNNSAYTIFVVAKQNSSNPSANGFNYLLKGNLSADNFLFIGANPSKYFATFTGPSGSWWDTNANTPNITTTNTTLLMGMNVNGSALTPYYNGNIMTAKTGTTGAFTGMRIGDAQDPYSGYCWNGLICEIIIYNTSLNDTQRQQIEGYLAKKWGLYSSIPSTHPFYNLRCLPASPLITPTAISGCSLWLDAADTTTITGTTSITQWNDKSGNGTALTVSTGTPSLSNFNGLPSVYFNGSTRMVSSNYTQLQNKNYASWFVVANLSSTNISYGLLAGTVFPTNSFSQNSMYVNANTLIIFYRMVNGASGNAVTVSTPSNAFVASTFTTLSNGVFGVGSNGTTTTGTGGPTGTIDTTAVNLYLGNDTYTGDAYITGTISEVLLFTQPLTNGQRQQVEGYLAWKWGLQNNLPSTHPYSKFRA